MDYGSLGNKTWSFRLSFFIPFLFNFLSKFFLLNMAFGSLSVHRISCWMYSTSYLLSCIYIVYILRILSCNGASCMYFIYVTYILYIQDVLTGVYMLYNLSCITSIFLVFLYNHALFLMFYVFAAFVFVWWP